ncbi:hypothetical protein ECP03052603_0402 [Escherichia coli P0305260.3]|nr:hypothetical protein ECP03052603_0402 [Escherichia coli P0305260.3]
MYASSEKVTISIIKGISNVPIRVLGITIINGPTITATEA